LNAFTAKSAAIKINTNQQFVDPTSLAFVQSSVEEDRLELLLQPCLDLFFVVQEIKMDWIDFIDDPYHGLDQPFPIWRLLEMMSGLIQSIYMGSMEPKEFYGFTAKFGFWYLRTWSDGKRIQVRLLLLEDLRIQMTWEGTAMDGTLKRVRRMVDLPEFPISPDNEKIRTFLGTRVIFLELLLCSSPFFYVPTVGHVFITGMPSNYLLLPIVVCALASTFSCGGNEERSVLEAF
jgi:hypothetical protein